MLKLVIMDQCEYRSGAMLRESITPYPFLKKGSYVQKEVEEVKRYEILFILRPDLSDADVEAHRERIKQVIEAGGGEIEKIDLMGKRRLAYEIEKFREGIYTVLYFKSDAATVKELERVVGITEPIIRHLIVRHDEVAS